jgi:dephospho-CoA kinase
MCIRKVGLTGGIGSGKTTIARIFSLLGIPVYDADIRAKQLMTDHPKVRKQVIELLGTESYSDDGQMNRAYIGEKIFNNTLLRNQLDAIVHPAVHQDFQLWAEAQTESPYVIDEAALIFESGGFQHLDKIILVTAPVELRIDRVMKRNSLKKEAVSNRMNAQWKDEKKLPLSDFVIINDGRSPLIRQVLEIHHLLIRENV